VSAEAPKTTKRRLAAVLGADAVGYSRLMSENEEATIDALTASRDAFFERYIDGLRLIDATIPDPRLASSRPTSGSITAATADRRSD
jgi:hypothetical protein